MPSRLLGGCRLKAPRPFYSSFAGVALVADHREIQYKLCLRVQKMFVGHAPDYTASLLTPASNIRSSLHSSSNCDLVVPGTSRKIGDRAFSVAAPRAWNRLPTDLKLLRSTVSFKSKQRVFCFMLLTPGTLWTLECAIGLIVGGAVQVCVVTVTVQQIGAVLEHICSFDRVTKAVLTNPDRPVN